MSDNYPVPAEVVRKNGMRGFFGSAGGLGLIIFTRLATMPVIGWIIGGVLIAGGVVGLLRKDRSDKFSNALFIAAGALGLGTIIFPDAMGFLGLIGGLGLIGYGVVSFVKFFKGLKSRS
ncbi:MAG: hypothetical protein KKI09_17190 [Spirochaetes bacterium]|nr:hypothetical protein [Spirochaetota bacterium]MBU0957163.1 hypothetical protein [Spirochaetota bacterium]